MDPALSLCTLLCQQLLCGLYKISCLLKTLLSLSSRNGYGIVIGSHTAFEDVVE